MSQHWGPPNYPPRPSRPQYQLPPPQSGYYFPEQRSGMGRGVLLFLIGSCSTLLLVACCVFFLAVAWIVDERLGITTPKEDTITATQTAENSTAINDGEQGFISTPTPEIPVTQITPAGPAPAEPFVIGQMVQAHDIKAELVVLDIQRNVQPNNFVAAPGMEFVAVSVQERSTEPSDFPKIHQITDFQLQNSQNVFYQPDPNADNGRRLENGELPQNGSPIEGDLLFHIPMGEAPLFLVWQNSGSAEQYTIILQ